MTMRFKDFILNCLLTTVVLFVSSCSPIYYNPVKQNVRVFENKGDIVATASVQPLFSQAGIDLGYAVTDNFGINSSYNRFNTSIIGGETNVFVKDFLWDNELIFYKNYKFGLFGAVNLGYGIGGFNVCNPYYKLSMNRYYAQPTLGFFFNKYIGLAISTRFAKSYYDISFISDQYGESSQQLIKSYFDLNNLNEPVCFIEPAFTLIVKWKYNAMKLQYVHSNSFPRRTDFNVVNLILSYSYRFNTLSNRK